MATPDISSQGVQLDANAFLVVPDRSSSTQRHRFNRIGGASDLSDQTRTHLEGISRLAPDQEVVVVTLRLTADIRDPLVELVFPLLAASKQIVIEETTILRGVIGGGHGTI